MQAAGFNKTPSGRNSSASGLLSAYYFWDASLAALCQPRIKVIANVLYGVTSLKEAKVFFIMKDDDFSVTVPKLHAKPVHLEVLIYLVHETSRVMGEDHG